MPRKRGNGDGTIYKMESKGLWAAQLTIGVDANGKPKRKTIYGKRQADVRAKLDALKNELATGSVIEPDKITVAQYILSLVETDRALNQIGDNTYLRKLASCKRIAASSIGDRPLQSVRPPQVTQYLIEITSCSNSVIAKDYALLARCFRTALDNDLIRKDPMRGMKKPKSSKATRKVRALTVEEQTSFVQVMNDQERGCRYWEQMMLMLCTGMRMGEINALDVHDVNLTFRTVNVRRTVTKDQTDHAVIGTKTKTYAGQRLLSLTDAPYRILSEYIEQWQPNRLDLLFYDFKGHKVLTTSQVNLQFQRILKKYNVLDPAVPGVVTLHSLRHTYATRCIESGMPVKVLQKRLGHANIETTLNTYCDVFADYEQKYTEAADAYIQQLTPNAPQKSAAQI